MWNQKPYLEDSVWSSLKSIIHVEIWMYFFTHTVLKRHALVVSKIVSHGFPHIFQMLAQFVIQLQKLSFMNSITGLMSQVYKYWKAVKLAVAFTSCYNIPWFFFLLKACVSSLATNVVSYFPSSLCSFSRKMSAKFPSLNKYSSLVLSSKNYGIRQKQIVELATQTLTRQLLAEVVCASHSLS